jgi:hypothetical protein
MNLAGGPASHSIDPMLQLRRRLLLLVPLAVSIFAAAMLPTMAAAQATVVIYVFTADGDPGEARVTLTEGHSTYTCQTHRGSCQIPSVRRGNYVVSAHPLAGGQPPIPRMVPVVPGTVTVSVTLR